MGKCLLIGVSLCAVILLVLASLGNVVGYQLKINLVNELSNRSKLPFEHFIHNNLWIHPDASKFMNRYVFDEWISTFQDCKTPRVLIPYTMRLNDSQSINNPSPAFYDGETLYVGGNGPGNYSLIQRAINAASDGDTVFVYAGIYRLRFRSLWIDKSIRLLGEEPASTIIIGKGFIQGTPVIDVYSADAVTISGFTLIRDLPSWCILQDFRDCGIRIYGEAQNCIISGNIFTKSVNGVLLWSYYGVPTLTTIANNIFQDNSRSGLISVSYTHLTLPTKRIV